MNHGKAEHLIHYVVARVAANRPINVASLFKIVWLIDASHFLFANQTLSGLSYVRRVDGPIPTNAEALMEALEVRGNIRRVLEGDPESEEKVVCTKPCEHNFFSSLEQQCIDSIVADATNTEKSWIKRFNMNYGWSIIPLGQDIPQSAFLAWRIRVPSRNEQTAIVQRAKEIGLIE